MAGRNASSDKNEGQTIDGETGKPLSTPRRIDLSTLRDVRLELAALYRRIDAGEVESSDGSRRAFVLKTIGEVIAASDLAKRIEILEVQSAGLGATQVMRPALAAH